MASVGSGFAFLFRSPRLWPAALVPGVLLVLLAAGLVAMSFGVVRPLIEVQLQKETSLGVSATTGFADAVVGSLTHLGLWLLPWLGAALAALLGLLLALAIAPALSAPALEHIVAAHERTLGVPERQPVGFWAELRCGLKAQVCAAVFAVPLLAVLALTGFLLPVASIATVPLECVVTSIALAWSLFDYPLTLRGVRMRDRLSLVATHWRPTLGFGLTLGLLFWLPCMGVVLLPVGVAAATRLVWRILLHDPKVVSELERPLLSRLQTPAPNG